MSWARATTSDGYRGMGTDRYKYIHYYYEPLQEFELYDVLEYLPEKTHLY